MRRASAPPSAASPDSPPSTRSWCCSPSSPWSPSWGPDPGASSRRAGGRRRPGWLPGAPCRRDHEHQRHDDEHDHHHVVDDHHDAAAGRGHRTGGGRGGRPIPGVSVAFVESVTTTGADGGFGVEASRAGPIVLTKAGLTTVEARWSGAPLEQVMSPSTIRGIRVGAGAAGSDEHFQRLIDLATVTSVNAFVFDTKQEGGQVLYDTRVQQAHDIGAVDVWYDAAERISRAEAAGLYTITRIVALEDAFWVRAHPEEKMAGPWADPTGAGIRRYVTDLAVEACELGFDEIQLDYVRYAAGSTASVTGQLSLSQEDRVANVASLIEEVRAA